MGEEADMESRGENRNVLILVHGDYKTLYKSLRGFNSGGYHF